MDEESHNRVAGQFDAVVRPHFDVLYRAAVRLTHSREDAEDLVQEVSLRAYPELDRLEGLESPRGWLLRVQYRIFVDEFRRRTRSPFATGCEANDVDLAASDQPGPAEQVEAIQRQRQLARVWNELDRKQRALLALHAEGYSVAELAAITGLSRNVISVRLHRARARLAKLLRNESTGGLQLVQLEG